MPERPDQSPLTYTLHRSVGFWPLVALTACSRGGQQPKADLIFRDAVVYTVDSTRPRAEAIAIGGGRILYVGTNDSAMAFATDTARVYSMRGRMILPGFQDTHVHPIEGGIALGECDLHDAATLDSATHVIRRCAQPDRSPRWVRGGGWQLPLFRGANPSRQLLDSLVPHRPAYLASADGHSAWVNSLALRMAGVTRNTPDPPNGRIERDAHGEPSGTLRESAADLVSDKLPPYTDDDYLAGLRRGLAEAARFGITTMHEASASEGIALAYARADSLGQLTARSIVTLHVNTEAPVDSEVRRLSALRARVARPDGLVRPVAAKIFMDGVIEAHTAALLAPYVDRPGFRADVNLPPAKFDSLVRALHAAGFKVHVHAIGDRAIRVALDGFAHDRATRGHVGRDIIAHLQLFDPADVARFAQLGVVADFQPLWAFRDSYIRDLTEPILGPARSRWMYPIASVVTSGAIVSAGSDWPVSSMNPLEAIQVGVTRRDPADTTDGPAWLPEQRVDLATMIRMYTLGGAEASDDTTTGMLRAGKAADLVVLSNDLFAIPARQIARTTVMMTVMGGRIVPFQSGAAAVPTVP